MSDYKWGPENNWDRERALWALELYYCGWFGECEQHRADGSVCGLPRDARGGCGAESQHVAAPEEPVC